MLVGKKKKLFQQKEQLNVFLREKGCRVNPYSALLFYLKKNTEGNIDRKRNEKDREERKKRYREFSHEIKSN